jgi:ribonuclease R
MMSDHPDHDIPADDRLIDYINQQPTPPKVKDIAKAFGLSPDLRAPLRRRLKKLAEDGRIKPMDGRRVAGLDHLPPVMVVEITAINDDGEGIATPLDRSNKRGDDFGSDGGSEVRGKPPLIRISHERRKHHHPNKTFAEGDRILAKLALVGPDEYQGQVIRKLDRHRQIIFGQVFKTRDGFGLEPVERGARQGLDLLAPDAKIPFDAGDMVEAELVKIASVKSRYHSRKTAKVIRNLGPAGGAGAFSALAIAEFDLPHVFPEAAQREANAAKPIPIGNREDLRGLPLVTIDGADARDFDDAVFAEPINDGGYRMVVAIADVAAYVTPESPLDREAQKRGNSVYLPDRVIPMLPEALSNGLCSLVPGEDRACLAVEMLISNNGEKISHRFFRGLMRSHARLTYDAVEDFRTGADTDPPAGLDPDRLHHLFAAYELRAAIREKRGALDLDLPEKRVVFDDHGHAIAISKKHQNTSQKLIEEFMILANVSAAETLEQAKTLCVYRAHEPPDPAKIDGLRDVVKTMGIAFPKGQVIRSQHFNALLKKAKQLGDPAAAQLVNETVLRCQSQADYRISNPGHFGLALRRYAHFTSPIRRYADLMVHRSLINQMATEDHVVLPAPDQAAEIAQSISETERKAAAAERRTVDRYATSLMQNRTGQIAEGKVTTITGFGAFIQIINTGAEGLMPLGQMPDDFYDIDTTTAVIKGQKTGITVRAGDVIDVMVLDVSPLKASVTLAWAEDGIVSTKRSGAAKSGPRGGRYRDKSSKSQKKSKSKGHRAKRRR